MGLLAGGNDRRVISENTLNGGNDVRTCNAFRNVFTKLV